jgi:hypothetical protein
MEVKTYQHCSVYGRVMQPESDPRTTITLPSSVRKRLRDYQVAGRSAADAIAYLMDKVPPAYFRRDFDRALAMRPRERLAEFRRRHRLPGR